MESECLRAAQETCAKEAMLIDWSGTSFSGRAKCKKIVKFWITDVGLSTSDSIYLDYIVGYIVAYYGYFNNTQKKYTFPTNEM